MDTNVVASDLPTPELQQLMGHFQGVDTWERDRLRWQRRALCCAIGAAALGWVTGILGLAAAAWEASRPPPDPLVLRQFDSTGRIEVLDRLRGASSSYNDVISKYFVEWYVRYREGYARSLAAEYYENVGLMSARDVFTTYAAAFDPKNADSPLSLYGDHGQVRIAVQSTTMLNPHLALVRYVRTVDRNGMPPEVSHWAAAVGFGFRSTPMLERARRVNPLGFEVATYRVDADAASPDPAPTPATAAVERRAQSKTVTVFPDAPAVRESAP